MRDINCPYCNAELEINHDDGYGYEEDEIHQQCGNCHKYFTFTTSISFYYSVERADCLNGGEHSYKKTCTYPPEFAKLICAICGEDK